MLNNRHSVVIAMHNIIPSLLLYGYYANEYSFQSQLLIGCYGHYCLNYLTRLTDKILLHFEYTATEQVHEATLQMGT